MDPKEKTEEVQLTIEVVGDVSTCPEEPEECEEETQGHDDPAQLSFDFN